MINILKQEWGTCKTPWFVNTSVPHSTIKGMFWFEILQKQPNNSNIKEPLVRFSFFNLKEMFFLYIYVYIYIVYKFIKYDQFRFFSVQYDWFWKYSETRRKKSNMSFK